MLNLTMHKKCTHNKLIDYGFKKFGTNYRLTFPIYTYNQIPVISISFLASIQDNYIGYDVINSSSDTLYSPYYDIEYSNKDTNIVLKNVIDTIHDIQKKMNNKKIIEI